MSRYETSAEERSASHPANSREGAVDASVAAQTAVEAAAEAFPVWSALAAGERRALLERAADLLIERQPAIASLVTEETAGTVGWGMFNVQLAVGMLRYYASQADAVEQEVEIPSHIPGKRAKAVRQPVGVVVGIAPWNAPVVLGVRAVAAPLAYGNTVVLKASEQCPRTHAAIVDALTDAGLPGRGEPGHQPARRSGRGGGSADRASGGAACQLHRIHPSRADRGGGGRASSQAGAARVGRQGSSRCVG